MTRKDYELIAETLRFASDVITVAPYDAQTALELVATLLADKLERDNSRFDRRKFIARATATQAKREAIIAQL